MSPVRHLGHFREQEKAGLRPLLTSIAVLLETGRRKSGRDAVKVAGTGLTD